MNLALVTILVGNLIVTSYRSVPECTDDSPFITSNGERVSPHGIAISRDLHKRWGGPLDYGDVVFVEGVGFKTVNDVMHQRHKRRADVWVATLKDEQVFHKKFGHRKLRVYKIKEKTK